MNIQPENFNFAQTDREIEKEKLKIKQFTDYQFVRKLTSVAQEES